MPTRWSRKNVNLKNIFKIFAADVATTHMQGMSRPYAIEAKGGLLGTYRKAAQGGHATEAAPFRDETTNLYLWVYRKQTGARTE